MWFNRWPVELQLRAKTSCDIILSKKWSLKGSFVGDGDESGGDKLEGIGAIIDLAGWSSYKSLHFGSVRERGAMK